jgi:8-oxo-dGTP pyrophosphatase MutT (NUDIX family)
MRWTVHGERIVYSSYWLDFHLADVELPTGRRFDYEVVRSPAASVGVVVTDDANRVLMLWRHRFIPDRWGWEIPAGRMEAGETPAEAGAREVLEETGWKSGPLESLYSYEPSPGIMDQVHHVLATRSPVEVGLPTDWFESERVAWLDLDRVGRELREGGIHDGMSLSALCWCFAFGHLPSPVP